MMQYNNIPSSNYKQIIYRKTNSPKYKIINRNANNFYKAKNNTLYHNPSSILSLPKFNNLYQQQEGAKCKGTEATEIHRHQERGRDYLAWCQVQCRGRCCHSHQDEEASGRRHKRGGI